MKENENEIGTEFSFKKGMVRGLSNWSWCELKPQWETKPQKIGKLGSSKVQTWIEWQKFKMRFSFTLSGDRERGRGRGRERGRCREKASWFSTRRSVVNIHDIIDSRSLLHCSLPFISKSLSLCLSLPSLFTLFSLPSVAFPFGQWEVIVYVWALW